MFDYKKIKDQVIESIEATGSCDAEEFDIDGIVDALRDLEVVDIDDADIDDYWAIVARNAC